MLYHPRPFGRLPAFLPSHTQTWSLRPVRPPYRSGLCSRLFRTRARAKARLYMSECMHAGRGSLSVSRARLRPAHALPDHYRCVAPVDHCVCAVGAARTILFGLTAFFAFIRAAWLGWSARCSKGLQIGLSWSTTCACSWLAVPLTHDSGGDFRQVAGPLNVESHG